MITITLSEEDALSVVAALDEFVGHCGPIAQVAFGDEAANLANVLRDRANITTTDIRERYASAARDMVG